MNREALLKLRAKHVETYKAWRAEKIAEEGGKPAICPACGKHYETDKLWRRGRARCADCMWASHYLRSEAAGEVARAIRLGRMLPAYTFRCTDCEDWASVYDHRDYHQPLKVDPVCQSCNMLRGPAHPFRRPSSEATAA